jgi:hypothetical protein
MMSGFQQRVPTTTPRRVAGGNARRTNENTFQLAKDSFKPRAAASISSRDTTRASRIGSTGRSQVSSCPLL